MLVMSDVQFLKEDKPAKPMTTTPGGALLSATAASTITGERPVLLVGMWAAWSYFALSLAYTAAVVASGAASGAASGRPQDPYWAIAEIVTIVGAPVLVTLMAAIHHCAPLRTRFASVNALAWILVWASLTVTVHFVELAVARRIDMAANPGFPRLFDFFEWPSLLYAVELVAWHLFLGLSLLIAALAFRRRGREAMVRVGLMAAGLLSLGGLIGPIVGDVNWRLIGVLGYGVVFPFVCLVIGLVFRRALLSAPVSSPAGEPMS
jgi:hypothetical protein